MQLALSIDAMSLLYGVDSVTESRILLFRAMYKQVETDRIFMYVLEIRDALEFSTQIVLYRWPHKK